MKLVNPSKFEEVRSQTLVGRYKANPVTRRALQLKVGQVLEVKRTEWKEKITYHIT